MEKGLTIDDMEYVLIFDSLSTDFDKIRGENGLTSLPHYNQKTNNTDNTDKEMLKKHLKVDSVSREKVLNLYSEDFIIYEKFK